MNIWILKCLAIEIILYRLLKICKDCSSFPDKNNNKQLAIMGCCFLCFRVSVSSRNNVILQTSRELWGNAAARDREKRTFFLGGEDPEKVKRGGSQEFRTTKAKESQHEKVNMIFSVASHHAAIRDGSSSIMQHGFSV